MMRTDQRTEHDNPRLKAALHYAKLGIPLLPLYSVTDHPRRCTCGNPNCPSPGKHPRTEHGLKDATAETGTIRGWWQKWPNANVGILTGADSGLVVLDVDPRHGGDKTLEELQRQHGPLPKTISQITGGGGQHLFFRHPGGYINSGSGKLGPGLDVKADGGYIVVAPSMHISGNHYTWDPATKDGGLAELPGWLLEKLREPTHSGTGAASDRSEGEPIPWGERNATLASLAGSMRRRGMTEEEILQALLVVNDRRCIPPLPEDEVKSIASSVARYAPARRPEDLKKERPAKNEAVSVETLYDLLSKNIPSRESLLGDGLIARKDLVIFSGPQKKGKSLLSLNLALCSANGKPWLGFPTKTLRVGIVQQEIPEEALLDRLLKQLGGGGDYPFLANIPHLSRRGLKLDAKEGQEELRRWLDVAKVDLFILDPLYTFHGGDENRARDMGGLFTSLQQIIEDYNLALTVIHHHGKPGQVEREGGDLHRGTSLLRDVSDANWTFTRVPANRFALSEPPSKYVLLSFEQRHCQAPDPLLLHLDPETLWFEKVEAREVKEVRAEEVRQYVEKAGGEVLRKTAIEDLKKACGVGETTVENAIYAAEKKGLIEIGHLPQRGSPAVLRLPQGRDLFA